MAKSVLSLVRVTDEVKAAAEKATVDDSRLVSSLVEKMLVDWLRGAGICRRDFPPGRIVCEGCYKL
jgi:hypothetical protein